MFSHDLVPDYLRTKPIPEVEQKMVQLEHKATNLSLENIQVSLISITPRSSQLMIEERILLFLFLVAPVISRLLKVIANMAYSMY